MLILGLLILLVAALFILYVVMGADGSTTLEAFNVSTTMPAFTLFLSGMVSLLALGLGLWLILAGTRRSSRKRKERRTLERDAREARAHREAGNARPVADSPRDGMPRYEDHQEPRPARSGEPVDDRSRDGLRPGEEPYPPAR
ncbi:hypothetical protein [Kytococcus sp. Marseille-QA3725]